MTDNANPQADEAAQPSITVNGQYIKDLSFEAPNAPQIFSELAKAAPEIPMSVDVRAAKLGDRTFEVVLHLHIESKVAGKTAFILEQAYAGVFTLNVPEEHVQPVLFIECPRMLFPFARAIVADATRDGGFPPLMLQPIDFLAMYRQRMEQVAAQQQEGGHA